MYSIGEFSRITGLSVKTLRFYHDEKLLAPAWVDPHTGYRYYGPMQIERARIIAQLRSLEFPLEQIREMLACSDDEADLLDFLERQKAALVARLRDYRVMASALDRMIQHEREVRRVMNTSTFEVEEKTLATQLIAGVRMRGKYSDCGKGFARLGKQMGRHACGKCFLLHYDMECRDGDADFEACMPVRRGQGGDGISVRELPGGRCVSLLHRGPYEDLGRSYARILAYVTERGYEALLPTREVYIKGPGMIFRGNPRNYLTEIQILVKEGAAPASAR